MVDVYIGALNERDVDALFPVLEESYRAEQETEIRAQVDELDAAGIQLSWTEDQLPGRTGSRSMAMVITVEGDDSGTQHWQVGFIELGERGSEEWVINFVTVKE